MGVRANKPISVTLGALGERAEARVRSGNYASVSEVVREGLRALDREEALWDKIIKAKVEEALNDPRPDLNIDDALKRMDDYIAAKRAPRGV